MDLRSLTSKGKGGVQGKGRARVGKKEGRERERRGRGEGREKREGCREKKRGRKGAGKGYLPFQS